MAALTSFRPTRTRPDPGHSRTTGPPGAFAEALAWHVMGWHRQGLTEAQMSHAITEAAVALIAEAQGAAILVLAQPGGLTIRAAHGSLPELLNPASGNPDDFPWRSHTGADWLMDVRDLPSPSSWPIFTALGGPSGGGSIICTPLGRGDTMFGTLLVAADDQNAFGAPTAETVAVLAMHACAALAAARDRTMLQAALQTRDIIGQAKGIVMERRRVTADDAFAELIHLSQISNTKLRDICLHITHTGAIPR